jgi:hypothetical protein
MRPHAKINCHNAASADANKVAPMMVASILMRREERVFLGSSIASTAGRLMTILVPRNAAIPAGFASTAPLTATLRLSLDRAAQWCRASGNEKQRDGACYGFKHNSPNFVFRPQLALRIYSRDFHQTIFWRCILGRNNP